MVDVASLVVSVESKGVKKAEQGLKGLGDQAEKTAGQTTRGAAAAKELRGGFRAMRGSTQQVSYQLQDIAVQAQMGTSAFTILGQQGPQLASAFGPGGAVAGAFIAFGAILGGLVYNHLTGTTKEMEDLAEAANELTDDITRLTAAEQAYQQILITEKIEDQKEALANLQLELDGAERSYFDITNGVKRYTETEEEFTRRTAEMEAQIALGEQAIVNFEKVIDTTSNTTEDLIEGLKEEAAALGKTQRQLDLATTAAGLAGEANRQLINDYHDQIDAQEKNEAATKAKMDADAAAVTKLENFNASVDNQRQLLELTGDALYLYQAQQAGATGADAQALAEKLRLNAELRETLRLQKQADAQAKRDEAQAAADAKRLAASKQAAQDELTQLRISGMDKLAAIDAQAQLEIENKAAQRDADLISLKEFEEAKTLIEQQAGKDRAAIELSRAKELEDAKQQIQQMALSRASAVAGQLAGALNDAYGEESAAAKSAFLLQQGLAMAQIVVSTEVAAAAAAANSAILTGLPGFLATAAAIRTMGAISLGIVAGQTIGGLARATGGQVRGGESYLVGERGPELLTMGGAGRVSSNDQLKQAIGGGGESVQIVNNVDARGAGPDVEMKIRTAMMQTSQQTIATIQDLMRRRRFV